MVNIKKMLISLGIAVYILVRGPNVSSAKMNDKKLDQAATITKVIQLEKGKNSFTTEDEVPVSTLNRAHNPKKLVLKSTNKRQYKALKFETYRLGPKDLKYSLTPFEQAKFRVLETLFTREILENFLFPRKDFLTKKVQRIYKITPKDFLTKSENSLSIEKQRQILNSRKNVLYDLIYKSDINEITANKILGITGGSIGMGALGVEFTKFIIKKLGERRRKLANFIRYFFDENDTEDCNKMTHFLKEMIKNGKDSNFLITLTQSLTNNVKISGENNLETARENALFPQQKESPQTLPNILAIYNILKQHYPKIIVGLILLALLQPNVRSFVSNKTRNLEITKKICKNLNSLNKIVQQWNDQKFLEKEQELYCSERDLLLRFAGTQIRALSKDLNALKDASINQNEVLEQCMDRTDKLLHIAKNYKRMHDDLLVEITMEYSRFIKAGGTLIPASINSNNKKILGLSYLLEDISKSGLEELKRRKKE
jgi:hypothetical protein